MFQEKHILFKELLHGCCPSDPLIQMFGNINSELGKNMKSEGASMIRKTTKTVYLLSVLRPSVCTVCLQYVWQCDVIACIVINLGFASLIFLAK